MNDVSALILAGGKATRMGGVAKHYLEVDGKAIIYRQLEVLVPRVADVILSSPYRELGARERRAGSIGLVSPTDPVTSTTYGPFRVAPDRIEGAGPLAGIAAGLAACTTEWMLVVAGDMPYLTGELIDRMLDERGSGVDAVGITMNGLPEPLVCVLHRRVLPVVERRIAKQVYKASGLLTDESLGVRWITDADPRALRNVNSPDDL